MMRQLMRFTRNKETRWVYLVSEFDVSTRKYNENDFYLASPCPLPPLSHELATELSEPTEPVPNAVTLKRRDTTGKETETEIPSREIILPRGKASLTSKGVKADKNIAKLFSAGLFFTPEYPTYMGYAPHMMFYTNTKTAKSWFAESVGVRVDADAASSKALIGFGTSDRVRLGSLAGLYGSMITIDELPEKLGEDLFGGLLTVMELGKVVVIKGLSEQSYSCASPIVFAGNPHTDENINGQSLYAMMDTMLRKVSHNAEAFGSRFGAVTFGLKFKPVEGSSKNKPREESLRNISLSREKMENGKLLVKELEREKTLDWLAQPYPQGYKDSINKFREGCTERMLADFLRGHLESFRHARGLALRLSLLDDSTPTQEFDWVMHHNLESFATILEFSSEYAPTVKQAYLLACTPAYLAYFFLKLGDAMARKNSKELSWLDLDLANMNAYTGMSQHAFTQKVLSAIQKDFSDDISATGETITIINPGVLNLVHAEKFRGAPWNPQAPKIEDAANAAPATERKPFRWQ